MKAGACSRLIRCLPTKERCVNTLRSFSFSWLSSQAQAHPLSPSGRRRDPHSRPRCVQRGCSGPKPSPLVLELDPVAPRRGAREGASASAGLRPRHAPGPHRALGMAAPALLPAGAQAESARAASPCRAVASATGRRSPYTRHRPQFTPSRDRQGEQCLTAARGHLGPSARRSGHGNAELHSGGGGRGDGGDQEPGSPSPPSST